MLLVLPLPVYSDLKEPQLHESIRTPLSSTLIAPGNPVTQISLSQAEQELIRRESGSRTNARNAHSTAFGLGQLLLANRIKYGRINDCSAYTEDYNCQLSMLRSYVADRYGTAEAALTFHNTHGFY